MSECAKCSETSARLAAAESEVRRLRRVINDAPRVCGKWLSGAFVSFETDGHAPDDQPSYVAKLVPIDELEANDG